MRDENEIKERFLSAVKDHTMTINFDNGIYRHITFSNNGSSVHRFELITWPGYLSVTGDMGCFVFSRVEDMFKFFRSESGELRINLHYWAEKIRANSVWGSGCMRFSKDEADDQIKIFFDKYIEECEEETFVFGSDSLTKDELWKEIEFDVLSKETEDEIKRAAARSDRHYGINMFEDLWEVDFKDYTFNYIWLCFAIVWGITQYDKYKKQ